MEPEGSLPYSTKIPEIQPIPPHPFFYIINFSIILQPTSVSS
jgi:hypothetical protein